MTVVGSIVGAMVYLTTLPQSGNGAKYGFEFVVQTLNPSRRWVVTHMTLMSVLHQWAHLVGPVISVTSRVNSWLRLVIVFSSNSGCRVSAL